MEPNDTPTRAGTHSSLARATSAATGSGGGRDDHAGRVRCSAAAGLHPGASTSAAARRERVPSTPAGPSGCGSRARNGPLDPCRTPGLRKLARREEARGRRGLEVELGGEVAEGGEVVAGREVVDQ